jgi:hypothetical protein
MNRDARSLRTPEGRFLRRVQAALRPEFGFNLHDQEVSSVGDSPSITAIALLAPAADFARGSGPVRKKAMRVAGLIARALLPFAGGRIASYDDAHEPRAFGDCMQAWGTSTVLIESGHWPGDPLKESIRRLNFIALLTAIEAIANGSYRKTPLAAYEALVPNGKRAFSIIVRRARVRHGKWRGIVDIGLLREPGKRGTRNGVFRIKEVGDLKGFGALEYYRGNKSILNSRDISVEALMTRRELNRVWGKARPGND